MRFILLAILFVVFTAAGQRLSPGVALASESREELHLDDVLRRTTVVLLAEPATPTARTAEVAITPEGKQADPVKYPPYVRRWQRWLVRAVVAGSPALVGQVLEIGEADWQTRLEVHRRYYLEGVSKWPIYEAYCPSYAGGSPPRSAERLIMLSGSAKAWQFAVDDAMESTGQLPKIKEALRRVGPDNPRLQPVAPRGR